MKYIILFVLLWMSCFLDAQTTEERETEWNLRTGTSLDYRFHKRWKTGFDWESRFNENISAYDESIAEWGITYTTPWEIKFQTSFRHYFTPEMFDSYRLNWGVGYGELIKSSPFKIAVLLRYQRDNFYEKSVRAVEPVWRFKVSFVYEAFGDLSFVLEDEIFYEQQDGGGWDKNRITAGIEWVLNDQMEVIWFYRFENGLNKVPGDFDHTFGIYLAFSLEKQTQEGLENPVRGHGHSHPW